MENIASTLKVNRPHQITRVVVRAKIIVWCIAFLCAVVATAPAHASAEDAVKAAFLYNFAKLTTWPSGSGPIVVGVIGSSSAGDMISAVCNGKDAGGRTLVVKHITSSEARSCQVVFVCAPDGASAAASARSAAVLTVGESPGFAGSGGCIGFVLESGRVRFEINKANVRKAHLELDGKLLNLGKIVG